jgi:phosphatidylglycerol---prolipoprotein diacylglyceryl transferase
MNLLNIVWNPSPIIPIGGFEIRWYGLLFALGFFFAYFVLYQIFKKEKVSFKLLDWLTFYFFIAVLVGARLGHVFFYEWDYYSQHLSEIPKVWEGGLASHGAAIGIILALMLYVWYYKVNVWWLFDRVAIVIPITAAFVRFGNLMNSEIYGHVTTLPWGFVYKGDHAAGLLPRHPTQLYEAFSYLLITSILLVLYKKKKGIIRPGLFVGIFLVAMFIARFLIEFLKEVQVNFERNMTIDMGQWLSIPFILLGAYFIYHSIKSNKIPPAPDWENRRGGKGTGNKE